ncbi:MAG: polyprenol monophosphomannose synthase [Ilumatobacter sp.]|nr:polyprenol monophosphomannose synthase [Ilumatobacter sp.]
MRTLIVVPTHNEAANVGTILDRLRQHVPDADVLVVDDASTDATREIVRARCADQPNLELVERDHKRGLGDAYLFAFRRGLDAGYDALVEIDADLSHDPSVLPTMLDIAERGINLVIGSRYVPGGAVVGWPRRRTWLSRWGNRYAAIVLGLAINDATAGYRVYRADTLRSISLEGIRAGGYGFQVEMTYRTVRKGLSVVEVPIRFQDRVAGESKMSRGIVLEAFLLVTRWGLADLFTLRRRRRAYRDGVT